MAISNLSLVASEDEDTSFTNQNSPFSYADDNENCLLEEFEDEEEEIDEVGEKKESKTAAVIKHLNAVGSSKKSIIEKLTEIEKAMDYLQKELREHEGSINEIDFGICQKRLTSSQAGSDSEAECNAIWIDNGNGLLPFIQKCLRNVTKYSNVIRWTNEKDLEFKIVDPEKFAKMWGIEKRKEGMTKRKLTRSLAYLVNAKGRLRRSTSRTFVYTIVPGKDIGLETPSPKNSPMLEQEPFSTPTTSTQPPTTLKHPPKRQISAEQLKKLLEQNPQYKLILSKLKWGTAAQASTNNENNNNNNNNSVNFNNINNNNVPLQFPQGFMSGIGIKRPFSSCPTTPLGAPTKIQRMNIMSPMAMTPIQAPSTDFMQAPANQSWRSLLEDGNNNFQDYSLDSSQVSPLSVQTDTDSSYLMNGSPMSDTSSYYQASESIAYADQLLMPAALPQSLFTGMQPATTYGDDDIASIIPTFSLASTTNGFVDTNAPSGYGINDFAKVYLQEN